jgi:protein-arginine kinase activator protein McsA
MQCQECGDESDELVGVRVGRKTVKMCESCAEDAGHQAEIAQEAEGAMQGMMEYKGR